jgi:outer membrane receptor protein involved in Fe transport
MRKSMMILLLMVAGCLGYAQQNAGIRGKVTDSKNAPLAGATVSIADINKTVATDADGNFALDGLPTSKTVSVTVSSIGYQTTTQVVDLSNGGLSTLNFAMKSDVLSLTDVVVTGVSNPRSKLSSSVSVSTLRNEDIAKAAPRTTAEIFRSIPGIKSEASGGDGNTNITVRGVPISAGGSKYLQLQEDGLPVLQFGDIAFATADIFLRADLSISKIEAIRGGSASTMATNSPAGIINFISKTGATEGGMISTTAGLDFGHFRTDFSYGSPLGNGVSFHVGGFYRLGEGPRTAGFTANNGGQLKMNLTKQFNKGYIRLYGKFLNDRAAAYMPMPIQVSGTNANPNYQSLSGFDAKHGTLHTPFLLQNFGLGANGERRTSDVADGMHPVSKSVGMELNFNLGEGWSIENRGRFSVNNGRFVAPFPASVGTSRDMLSTIASAKGWNLNNATLRYANSNTAYTGTNAMIIHMFDTELNNFNLFANDFKLKKRFNGGELTFGYYKSYQNISMAWLWNSYLTDVKGEGSRPLDIVNAGGRVLTQNGQFAYGVPVWGNCCQRSYDTKYDISAPSINLGIEATESLTFDAGLRWDIGKVTGNYAGSSQSAQDVNLNGTIDSIETSVSNINRNAAMPVNYKYDYVSFSVGANYKLNSNQAVFARFSRGAAAKADRILFSPSVFNDGSARGAIDKITQAEVGFKSNFRKGGLFVTGFFADVNEAGGYEATTQRIIENNYRSFGIELEANFNITNELNIRGSFTYTKAKITDTAAAIKNNMPRRQAPLIYNVVPTYSKGRFSAGLSIIGTTASYAQDNNLLKLDGYVLVNPFISYRLTKQLFASINGNNIFNSLGITESEEGSIVENQNNIIRARSVTGRTISATIGFNF